MEQIVADLWLVGGRTYDASRIGKRRLKQKAALQTNRKTTCDVYLLHLELGQLLDLCELVMEAHVCEELMRLIDNQSNHLVLLVVPVTTSGAALVS
jgi:hypothetical protein